MMLRGTQINYMPDKSHVIIITINRQGQIIQIMLRAANSIYSPHFAIWPAKRSVSEMAVCQLAACSDNNDGPLWLVPAKKCRTLGYEKAL